MVKTEMPIEHVTIAWLSPNGEMLRSQVPPFFQTGGRQGWPGTLCGRSKGQAWEQAHGRTTVALSVRSTGKPQVGVCTATPEVLKQWFQKNKPGW